MTLEETRELLQQVLIEIQNASGRSVPEIHDGLHPIGDIEGFDSLNALEAACLLSEYLGYDINSDLLLPTYPGRQLTFEAIVDRLYQAINAQGGLST